MVDPVNLVARVMCALTRHRWRTLRVNWQKHVALMHLHPLAGKDCVCDKCGHTWHDFGPWPPGNLLPQLRPTEASSCGE